MVKEEAQMKARGIASKFFLIVLICALLIFPSALKLSRGQGIYTSTAISSDTSWTSANSPYNIAGSIVVNSGVTLTLETGTTLNLNGYMTVSGTLIIQPDVTVNIVNASGYIQVNGVLSAVGTSAEPIRIVGTEGTYMMGLESSTYYPSITFSSASISWNAQMSTGSTIQNAILSSVTLSVCSSAELSNDTFKNGLTLGGGSPVIADCQIDQDIGIEGGAPIVAGNNISGGIGINSESQLIQSSQTTYIEDNVVSGNPAEWMAGITILQSLSSSIIIERNTISTSTSTLDGIDFAIANNFQCSVIVENNTITNNKIGIDLQYGYPESISGNNIYDNSLNVNLDNNHSFNCSNNWWGTTDPTAIGDSIHDFKDDFTLGTITFEPFLTAPNPEATPNPNLLLSTPTASSEPAAPIQSPTYSPVEQTTQPSQPVNTPTPAAPQNSHTGPAFTLTVADLLMVIAVLLAVIAGFIVAVVVLLRKPRSAGAKEVPG